MSELKEQIDRLHVLCNQYQREIADPTINSLKLAALNNAIEKLLDQREDLVSHMENLPAKLEGARDRLNDAINTLKITESPDLRKLDALKEKLQKTASEMGVTVEELLVKFMVQ